MDNPHVPFHGNAENMSHTDLLNAIQQCVDKAIAAFNEKEEYLIRNNLSERCVCSKFAIYLDREIQNSVFSGYVIDVEYNRGYRKREHAIKQLHGKNINVDLIVHRRGYHDLYGFDNLICIEMKKTSKPAKLQNDKNRLRCLTDKTHGFHYKAGFMIVAFSDHKQNRYGLQIETTFYNGRVSST